MTKRRIPKDDTARVRVTFGTVRHTYDRLRALAKRDGMKVTNLIAEAIYIHLHRLESNGDPRLRRKSVCWSCGDLMDAANGGTPRAGPKGGRTTKS
jgi:hypothetical protein